MVRVLLINPPSPEQFASPPLGLQYVASALLARGCEVRVLDAAARHFSGGADRIAREAAAFRSDIIGVGLFTRWVWHAYQMVDHLRESASLLVAGGPHATVRAHESLRRGFHVAIRGEAELAIVRLVDWFEGRMPIESIAGICYRGRDGTIHDGPPVELVSDLDALPLPLASRHLFDPFWYDPQGREAMPGGVVTSRGCPGRCTFCANYVTGRRFRYRSAGNVVAELNAYHDEWGAAFFPFWDDALTANPKRVFELCSAFEHGIRFNVGWSAITRASMITPAMLKAMRRAGLAAVNFGIESGDDEILRAIHKDLRTEQAVRALEWSKAEGLRTIANFMLGFPQETPQALERTLRFMERITPLVDTFCPMGVLVPFPGTPIYEEFHERYGFTDWWLREECSHYSAPPSIDNPDRFYHHYLEDANLELDFFRYPEATRGLIRECLRYKAEHNLRRMGLPGAPALELEPAGSTS